MADEQAPKPTVTQNLVPTGVYRAKDYKLFYSQVFRFRVSTTDIAISFGTVTDHPGDMSQSAVEEGATTILAFPQAKIFAQHLSKLLAALEAKLGPIKVPPNLGMNDEMAAGLVESLSLVDSVD